MKKTTLCLAIKEGKILLAMKKRGFGTGKWNGYGGKPKEGEELIDTALREMEEEVGLIAKAHELERAAVINFFYAGRPEWDTETSIFLVNSWEGIPSESEEMLPQWFGLDEIPFHEMWPDDSHWLPKILAGKRLEGEFYFSPEGKIEKFDLREINL